MYDAAELLKMSELLRGATSDTAARWLIYKRKDGCCNILPADPPPALFRGQNKRYSPCLPSIYRRLRCAKTPFADLKLDEQASLVIDRAKSSWFCRELDSHPAIEWAKDEKIRVNRKAVTQHYELPTEYIDASQSFDVAAFFATCCSDGCVWRPLTEGIGIIYKAHLKDKHPASFAIPIGLTPFPRPAEQLAWLIEPGKNVDFESLPSVSYIAFKHNKAVSQYFLDLFDCGRKLFPPDPMSSVAEKIKHSTSVPPEIIDAILEELIQQDSIRARDDLVRIREKVAANMTLVESLSLLNRQEKARVEQIWNERRKKFFEGVGFRIIKDNI